MSGLFEPGVRVSKEEEVLNTTFESLRERAIDMRVEFDRHIHELRIDLDRHVHEIAKRLLKLESRAEKLEDTLGAKTRAELDSILYVLQLIKKSQGKRRCR